MNKKLGIILVFCLIIIVVSFATIIAYSKNITIRWTLLTSTTEQWKLLVNNNLPIVARVGTINNNKERGWMSVNVDSNSTNYSESRNHKFPLTLTTILFNRKYGEFIDLDTKSGLEVTIGDKDQEWVEFEYFKIKPSPEDKITQISVEDDNFNNIKIYKIKSNDIPFTVAKEMEVEFDCSYLIEASVGGEKHYLYLDRRKIDLYQFSFFFPPQLPTGNFSADTDISEIGTFTLTGEEGSFGVIIDKPGKIINSDDYKYTGFTQEIFSPVADFPIKRDITSLSSISLLNVSNVGDETIYLSNEFKYTIDVGRSYVDETRYRKKFLYLKKSKEKGFFLRFDDNRDFYVWTPDTEEPTITNNYECEECPEYINWSPKYTDKFFEKNRINIDSNFGIELNSINKKTDKLTYENLGSRFEIGKKDYLCGLQMKETDTIPILSENNTPYLPLKCVIESYGGKITTNSELQYSSELGDYVINWDVNNKSISVNGETVSETLLVSDNGKALVPYTFFSDYLGFESKYIEEKNVILLLSKDYHLVEIKEKLCFDVDVDFYYLNYKRYDMDVKPSILNGRTLLPARYVCEPLGGDVSWDGGEKKVTCKLGDKTVELWIGKSTAKVNGIEVQIDPNDPEVVPTIINDRTMVPMRFLAESLGCEVEWISETKEIILTYAP